MKIPKKIKINSRWWKIEHKDDHGGEFQYKKKLITIDLKSEYKLDYFFHEVMEILMVEEKLRYQPQTDTNYRFLMNHDEFSKYVESLVETLRENKLL